MFICAAHSSWVSPSKSTKRIASYSSNVKLMHSDDSILQGANAFALGIPQIRRFLHGLGIWVPPSKDRISQKSEKEKDIVIDICQ